jgi:hypothetical protein
MMENISNSELAAQPVEFLPTRTVLSVLFTLDTGYDGHDGYGGPGLNQGNVATDDSHQVNLAGVGIGGVGNNSCNGYGSSGLNQGNLATGQSHQINLAGVGIGGSSGGDYSSDTTHDSHPFGRTEFDINDVCDG